MTSLSPEDDRQFLSSVETLLEQRLFDRAQDLAEQRLRCLPDDVAARIGLCRVWMKTGRFDQVEEILREVEERITEWSRVYTAMGDICRESGLKKEAARFYGRSLALHPQVPSHQHIAEKEDRLPAGVTAADPEAQNEDPYDSVADIAPDFHTLTLAELYLRQNHFELAREVLKEILRREPDHAEAAARLRDIDGRLQERQGQTGGSAHERVLQELTRWLQNIGRIGSYAT
jgi:tetratricopeptide (TPR) repeat protein